MRKQPTLDDGATGETGETGARPAGEDAASPPPEAPFSTQGAAARLFRRLTLGVAGASALGVGLAIALAPRVFYGGYDVDLGDDPSFLSELRAPGANLAMLGAVIFAGALRPKMAQIGAALGAAVFLAFAAGRLVGLALDGPPSAVIVAALVFEAVVGVLCLLVLHAGTPLWGARRAFGCAA